MDPHLYSCCELRDSSSPTPLSFLNILYGLDVCIYIPDTMLKMCAVHTLWKLIIALRNQMQTIMKS